MLIPSLLVLGSKAGPVPKGRARREISTFKALGKLKEDVWMDGWKTNMEGKNSILSRPHRLWGEHEETE